MRNTTYRLLPGLIFAITSFFCAGQAPPSGGPVDTTPPEIVFSYPAVRALQFHDTKCSLTFSKYVDKRSVEESIFISPSVGELTFDWGGTDVEIHFSDSIRQHTTYVLTIGTDVVDTRNHNRMATSFALPFSTGDHIDTAVFSGKVYNAKPEGIMIFAYRLTDRNRDTLNPAHVKPDYLTQTGKEGSFTLPYLAIGAYRLIAVRDEFKNLVYDKETDQYGIPASDFVLSDSVPSIREIQFRMTGEDTTPPFLSSAHSLDQSHVLLRFSEPMDTSQTALQHVSIVDTLRGTGISVYDIAFVGPSFLEAQLVTARQESLKVYRVTLDGFRDLHGNVLSRSGTTALFNGSGKPDTMKPVIQLTNISDSTKRMDAGDSLHFFFSETIHRGVFEHGFRFQDSSRNDVQGKFLWWNDCSVSFVPVMPMLWNARYTVTIVMDSVVDVSGNHLKDSVWVLPFRTVDDRLFGIIRGNVIDETREGSGKYCLQLSEVSKKNVNIRRKVLDVPGPFEIDRVPEGKYSLFAFRDADGDGDYSYGRVAPFKPSERFASYPDTLKVRARWTVEGVTIRFK